jgi:hypothetical protein
MMMLNLIDNKMLSPKVFLFTDIGPWPRDQPFDVVGLHGSSSTIGRLSSIIILYARYKDCTDGANNPNYFVIAYRRRWIPIWNG